MINLIKKIYRVIKKKLYCQDSIILFEYKYNDKNDKNENKLNGVRIESVTDKNINDILDFQPKRYVEVFNDFLAKGDEGFYAYIDNKCIHRTWVVFGPEKVNLHWSIPYILKKNELFVHYCETSKTARGLRVYPEVLQFIINRHSKKNTIIIAVNEKNTPSIKGVLRAGFTQVKVNKTFVFLGMKFNKSLDL